MTVVEGIKKCVGKYKAKKGLLEDISQINLTMELAGILVIRSNFLVRVN